MAKKSKVPVSRRAVLLRTNRKLAKSFQALKTWRTTDAPHYSAGDLYRVDFSSNTMMDKYVDLESFARELGVLADWEKMTE